MKKVTRSNYKPSKGEKIEGKSLTVQDDAISIPDLLKRLAAGQSLTKKEGVFIDDSDHDDIDGQQFQTLDLSEKEDVLEGIKAMRQRLKNLELEYEQEAKKRLEAKKNDPQKEPKNEG